MKSACLVWNEKQHEIGVAPLDAQHRQIVVQVNRLITAIEQNADSKTLQEALKNLILLARRHFDYEERLMKEHDFPGLESHAREHSGLLQKLDMFSETLAFSAPHRMNVIRAFVTDWAELHLLKGEKVLGEYLVAKGLS